MPPKPLPDRVRDACRAATDALVMENQDDIAEDKDAQERDRGSSKPRTARGSTERPNSLSDEVDYEICRVLM
jgi:hypothetical protein